MPRFLWEYLKETNKPIVIYGMGDGCDKIMAVCKKKCISVQGIFCSDEYVRAKTVHGFPLMGYSDAKKIFGDMIVLLAFGAFREDLMEKILAMDRETELYAPDVPLFGGELFDRNYYEKHKRDIRYAKGLLADERSQFVYDSILEYKITGRIAPLLDCQSQRETDLTDLLPVKDGDRYLDLGAYDGDTAEEWNKLFPRHGGIIAVEPNAKTYKKLQQKGSTIPRFKAIEAAVWYQKETLYFNGKSGRAAAVSNEGPLLVQGRRADEICQRAEIIKYDVEGVEREALLGSAGLIRNGAHSLIVSAYHKTEDLFTLPPLVHAMNRGYKIHLRHSPYVPAWDTLYFFIKE